MCARLPFPILSYAVIVLAACACWSPFHYRWYRRRDLELPQHAKSKWSWIEQGLPPTPQSLYASFFNTCYQLLLASTSQVRMHPSSFLLAGRHGRLSEFARDLK